MRSHLSTTAALLMPLLLAVPAAAQTASGSATGHMSPATMAPPVAVPPAGATSAATPATLSATDKSFVEKAAQGGVAEVQLAQLAQQKSQDSTIKQFADTMIDDHTPANEKLAKLAAAQGMTAPTEPSAAQQKMASKLEALNGTRFDHAYITSQLKAHKVMLKLFETEADKGSDPDLKAFAQTTVPVIQKHIDMATADKSSS